MNYFCIINFENFIPPRPGSSSILRAWISGLSSNAEFWLLAPPPPQRQKVQKLGEPSDER